MTIPPHEGTISSKMVGPSSDLDPKCFSFFSAGRTDFSDLFLVWTRSVELVIPKIHSSGIEMPPLPWMLIRKKKVPLGYTVMDLFYDLSLLQYESLINSKERKSSNSRPP